MQFNYTTIVSLIILIFNLWMAIEGGYLDSKLIILAVLQVLIMVMYIVLFVINRTDEKGGK
nr:MAG TPA: hypothetical protein [Caudoviricetes sp.]